MSRWHEDCLGRCDDCIDANPDNAYFDPYRRFASVGPLRSGAGSPPPPGAGPRYRSQGRSGWAANSGNTIGTGVGVAPDDPRPRDRHAVLRRAPPPARPPTPTPTLDRLPRFRFGGNRAAADRRGRELADRLRRGAAAVVPVPPPRSRHHAARTLTPTPPPAALLDNVPAAHPAPLRSASFSQVDFCVDDNKYVRRQQTPTPAEPAKEVSTLPRPKNGSRPATPRPGAASEDADVPPVVEADRPAVAACPGRRREKARRRKGIYIDKLWSASDDAIPRFVADGDFPRADPQPHPQPPAASWTSPQEEPLSPEEEAEPPAPPEWPEPEPGYAKRPLRGPYGQMLENEMRKPDGRRAHMRDELRLLDDLAGGGGGCAARGLAVGHQRTASSPSKLGVLGGGEGDAELLERLLAGSSERLAAADVQRFNDTRTHVVVELYDNEKSYVESLRTLVTKYLEPLKTPENANVLDANLVDEIFYQIPFLYNHHQAFLAELKKRLEQWGEKQKIGDVILDMFSKAAVIDSYTNYVNNWKRARDTWKSAQQKPAFSKFVEATARQNAGKLTLDSLLIKPIQRFPKYELILQRLIKHTDEHHPDHGLLLTAHQQVHDQLLKINCTERETLELDHLREIEGLIDGLIELAAPDRQYLRHDLVSMSHGSGPRKERALFLFSDILLITGIKRRSGTAKRPQGTLEANKYKLLMRIPLEDIDIVRSKDDNLKQILREVDNLTDDISILNQMSEMAWSLHCNHSQLDEVVREMLAAANKQLAEQQNSDSQLACLDLTIAIPNGSESVAIIFSKPEKRTSWEESLSEAKQKLALTTDRRPSPELVATVPIRKTRAGLQFTCAAPTLGDNGRDRDVWVCNSDGYVGQVCVLSLTPEPTVISCNGVCSARILCIASVPGVNNGPPGGCCREKEDADRPKSMHFDSSSSSEDEDNCDNELNEESQRVFDFETCIDDNEETDTQQSTMWLGTEDGCIHVYNCCDNIRIKKNKVKLQLGTPIFAIIYIENRVFAALANGDIIVYSRDSAGGWNISSPTTCTVGSGSSPVTKLVPSMGSLWCACGSYVKTLNTTTLATNNAFSVNDNKTITGMVISGNGVWLSLQNSAIVRCHHTATFDLLCEINVAPAVTKMLTSCDDIIRQHKAACLRVTSLVACKDLVWIGTSAGVLLTMPLPHVPSASARLAASPTVTGVPHGHTGHVRFLTAVEAAAAAGDVAHRNSYKAKPEARCHATKVLVISGGDGYEDFRTSNLSEVAGREDSTNHLLLWNI